MVRSVLSGLLMACLALGAVSTVRADDDGWSLAKLNPFRAKSEKRVQRRVTDRGKAETSGLTWPKLPSLSSGESRPAKKPSGPSSWQRLSRGTKQFFSKTYDVLTPWDNGSSSETTRVTGTRRTYSAGRDEEDGSFFGSLFGGQDEEEHRIESVNDFLRQERVW